MLRVPRCGSRLQIEELVAGLKVLSVENMQLREENRHLKVSRACAVASAQAGSAPTLQHLAIGNACHEDA